MEVAVNFNFDSTSTTPFTTAPSSPTIPGAGAALQQQQQLRYYTSAPTSPSSAAALYRHFRSVTMMTSSVSTPSSPSSVIPFDWEETPGTPKSPPGEEKQQLLNGHHDEDDDEDDVYSVDDFAFEFSGQLVHDGAPAYTATADELFEAGKIRPLKPPPRLYVAAGEYDAFVPGSATAPTMSPRSPKSPTSAARTFFMSSPCRRRPARRQSMGAGEGFVDPFEVAMMEATRGRDPGNPTSAEGGERARARRRPSRSLSPLRGLFDFGGGKSGGDSNYANKTSAAAATTTNTPASPASTTNGGLAKGSSNGSKKWRLRDLFLFRSASEGRATGDQSKDPLRKYTAASGLLSPADSARGSSFRSTVSRNRDASRRSTGGDGSVGGSSRRGEGSVGGSSRRSAAANGGVVVPSPHEVHYATNRAVSEELRRKTFLPYRQGLLGCLGFRFAGGGASLARGLSSVGVGPTVSSRRF